MSFLLFFYEFLSTESFYKFASLSAMSLFQKHEAVRIGDRPPCYYMNYLVKGSVVSFAKM